MEEFKSKHTLEQRKLMSEKQRNQYPDKLPLIICLSPFSKLSPLNVLKQIYHKTSRFVCQGSYNIKNFVNLSIKKIKKVYEENHGITIDFVIFFAANKPLNDDQTIAEMYNKHQDDDGFLYLTFDRYQNPLIQTIGSKIEQKSEEEQQFQLQQVQIKVKCIGNNQAMQICSNKQCMSESIFICFQQSCQCRIKHQKCTKLKIQSAVKKVQKKFISFEKSHLEDQINKVFDMIIDEVSTIRDRLISSIKQNIKNCQVQYEEFEFLNVVSTGQQDLFFNPIKFKQLLKEIKSSAEVFKKLRASLDVMKQINLHTFSLCKKELQYVDKFLKNVSLEESLQAKSIITEKLLQAKNHVNMKESSIISNDADILNLWLNFHQKQSLKKMRQDKKAILQEKPFASVKMLFKASLEDFNINSYFEKCGSTLNTFILCRTNKNKIIGAYSPLSHSWDSKENAETPWKNDKQGKSFIFSLTNLDKFELKNSEKAIYRDPERKCIRFGEGEFEICDKSNLNQECFTEINKAYDSNFCQLFYRDKVYQYVNGNSSSSFTTKEWEVWQLQF